MIGKVRTLCFHKLFSFFLIITKKFKLVESEGIAVKAGNMELTSVSADRRIWTFTPNHSSLDTSEWAKNKKVFLLAYFDNLSPEAIQKAKKAALLFFRFKMPNDSANCLVDRFDQYPLKP